MRDKTACELSENQLNEFFKITNIGTWDWDVSSNKVIYSSEWAEILGYTLEELPQLVNTWENMVLPEDLEYANEEIHKHLSGEKPVYEAEFRMRRKDGSIIWAQDKGKVTEYSKEGKPLRFVGVLQDVTRLKKAELQLRESRETLDLAVSAAELGTWDWDILGNTIRYNDEYLRMLGYTQDEINGSMEEWEGMNHPDDLQPTLKALDDYITGKTSKYECEVRMKRKDGSYIWTRDLGRIVARDSEGKPTRLIGGHLNIDALKNSENHLKDALRKLEENHQNLESKITLRTKELIEQDRMLWTVNKISRDLLTYNSKDDFDALIRNCLGLICESTQKNRVYIWKDYTDSKGDISCSIMYEWINDAVSIKNKVEEIPYSKLPSFVKAIDAGVCLNSAVVDLAQSEREIMEPLGVKSILIAPVTINGVRWGFVGVDNCKNSKLFTASEEAMLSMSGAMFASIIEKVDNEAKMREMEERTQLLLNATPLCLNLWTSDMQNMTCNDEAVRLFELNSQEEYLERFFELSPEYQPCGKTSAQKAVECIKKALEEGYCRFEWAHQKLDGTPIPAEVTLVRIKYKDGYVVAGYTRDLREQKEMLAKLQAKEDDLRNARDEALLSSKAKSNFLANMSHEIRTPMNAISGLAEIILRESEGRQSAEHAIGIKSACTNLLNIINDILDISKIESGKLEIVNAPYELASLLNDVITISRMRLGSKPLMFITDIDSTLPAKLLGDEIRVKQILINLISNAIKFTQGGYIAIKVFGIREANKLHISFSVTDSGIGIKEEDIARLFEEFERVNTTKNRNIEGTGLGLAISKQLCEMMGGSINVESKYKKGSTFTVTIPQEFKEYQRLSFVQSAKNVLLYEPRELLLNSVKHTIENLDCTCVSCINQSELYDNLSLMPYDFILTSSLHFKKVQALKEKNKINSQIAVYADYGEVIDDESIYLIFFPINCLQMANMLNGQKYFGDYTMGEAENSNFIAPSARILVVDDNPVNLKVAAGLMAPYQFNIDTAVNGIEAIEKIKENTYDLVFMDHMMPEMDGIDATIAIRELEGEYFRTLPIVALTANAIVGTREMFINEGMNDFLAKPIEVKKLGGILAKWIPASKKIKNAKDKRGKKPHETLDWRIKGVDVAQGVLSVGGVDNYKQIIGVYYGDGKQKCASLLNHFTAKAILDFKTEVHALKSASATIGAMELSVMAAKLEEAAHNNNIQYIDDNIDVFLTSFEETLDGMEPYIQESMGGDAKEEEKPKGDLAYLKDALKEMEGYAEVANIGRIEDILAKVKGFGWEEDISIKLDKIKECIAMFDYDGVLECIEELLERF